MTVFNHKAIHVHEQINHTHMNTHTHTASTTAYFLCQSQASQPLEQMSILATKWISVIYQSTVDIHNSKIPEYTDSNSTNI